MFKSVESVHQNTCSLIYLVTLSVGYHFTSRWQKVSIMRDSFNHSTQDLLKNITSEYNVSFKKDSSQTINNHNRITYMKLTSGNESNINKMNQ